MPTGSLFLRRSSCAVAASAAALAVWGCGTGTTGGPAQPKGHAIKVSLTPPAAGCGSVPATGLQDPAGIIKALPAAYAKAYASYGQPALPSVWRSFRPSHPPPYRVAIVWGPLQSDFQTLTVAAIKARLAQSPQIGKVTSSFLGSLNIPEQIQQFVSAIQSHPDLMIVQPGQADPFIAAIRKAAKAGIPTVTVLGGPAIAQAINVDDNNYVAAAQSAARAMRLIGGKGTAVLVHGVIGLPIDNIETQAFHDAVKRCPGVKVGGDVTGSFSNATAKSETLKFLGTHPGAVSAVLQIANMAPGVMSAFQQTGRAMPVVTDIGNQKGSLGYWRQNEGRYSGVGAGLSPTDLGHITASVALRTLEGQGPRTNTIVNTIPLITEANLAQWTQSGWNLRTPGTATGPPHAFATEQYLNPLFVEGSIPK